jgi:hypothetical protein
MCSVPILFKGVSVNGQVAQLVEQRTENPCVGGSIPPLATIIIHRKKIPALRVERLRRSPEF